METLIIREKDKLFFSSDLHLGHENIILYSQRPFKDKYHMDRVIIDNWNSEITNDDTVFILGDFCWGDKRHWESYLENMYGKKILIQGNHDRNKDIPYDHFVSVYEAFLNIEVKDTPDQRITLCHYPMLSWLQSHKGSWNLFGHWHSGTVHKPEGNGPDDLEVAEYVQKEEVAYHKLRPTQYDVGIDGNSYKPISYNQVKKIINEAIHKV